MDYAIGVKIKKKEIFYSYENKLLPTWKTKNNIIKYTLPSELQHLTLAEKILIQCVSPLVPVVHIKNGILGTRGHVVSFFQDTSGICTELPRLFTDITTSHATGGLRRYSAGHTYK